MFLFDVFRSFLPLHNSIGFGPADFIELPWRRCCFDGAGMAPWIQPYALKLRSGPAGRCCCWLCLPVCFAWRCWRTIRPSPDVYDEFGTASGRHAAPLPPGQSPHPCPSSSRRSLCCKSHLQFHLPGGPRPGVALGAAIFAFPGPEWCFRGGLLRAVLLDAACLDHAGVGALAGGLLAVAEFGP